jgi:transcriptional regulator GlxA family with amidase domain
MAVVEVDPDVLDAFLRLVELLDRPEQIPVLAPMIIREIHYRLLIGPQGERLRMINTLGTQSNQIARSITWLKENYREPLQVDELARKVNMATSTFHRHFRQVTTLSPLQFQKRMRLFEAQRRMLVENEDASIAALAVGYESPTQFNREYKRQFGEPPHRNVNQIR